MVQETDAFLSDEALELIEKNFIKKFRSSVRTYKRGEILPVRESDTNRICLLLAGTAYLTVEDASGGKQILNYFVKGQIIYYGMMVQPGNGHSYLIAKYPCRVAFFTRDHLRAFSQTRTDRGLANLPEYIFQSCITNLQQHCHILQQKTIRSKLFSFLYFQASQQKSLTVRIPIPYSDLADYLSIDRSALTKELTRMCQEKLIEKDSRTIRLLVTTPYF